jgi:hypothetical protein
LRIQSAAVASCELELIGINPQSAIRNPQSIYP